MPTVNFQAIITVSAFVATIAFLLYKPVTTRLIVFGVYRPQADIQNIHGLGALQTIPDTALCEDLHIHKGLLYAACQDSEEQRLDWFPPLAHFKDHENINTGSITVVDPTTFTSKKLKLEGFTGGFVTHGIDIVEDRDDPTCVYIMAVNHLPNPLHYSAATRETREPEKGRSQIEIFKHKIGSDEAAYMRTVRHPSIRTPNDVYSVWNEGQDNPSFWVTNDHYYREGYLRMAEDVLEHHTAAWTDLMHIQIEKMHAKGAEDGITVTQALKRMHNNNGLGHGPPTDPAEVLIVDASGGMLHRARRDLSSNASPTLNLVDQFQLPSTLDNPSYYVDEYATKDSNASGYVLPGLGRAAALADDFVDPSKPLPVMVWHLSQIGDVTNATTGGWEPKLIFQDDGYKVRGSSGAVIVGIDPKTNNGKKQGWLFVTGFLTSSMVAAKIDL